MDLNDRRRSSRSGENGGNCVEASVGWRTSARSAGNGGNCVEIPAVEVK